MNIDILPSQMFDFLEHYLEGCVVNKTGHDLKFIGIYCHSMKYNEDYKQYDTLPPHERDKLDQLERIFQNNNQTHLALTKDIVTHLREDPFLKKV